MAFFVYVHLSSTAMPGAILETVKLQVRPGTEESKEGSPTTIGQLAQAVVHYLQTERNDGNKVYHVDTISAAYDGQALSAELLAGSAFEEGSDVFATVRIEVDASKHVKPLSSAPVQAKPADDFTAGRKPFKTLTKYSYAESGTTLIKVLLPELDKLSGHPADKLRIEF